MVIALYLEGLPSHEHLDTGAAFETGPLTEAVVAVFALGCAVGVDHADLVEPILGQTHPGAVEEIIEECRQPLQDQATATREAGQPLEPEDFVDALLQGLEQGDHADAETAHNALSMAFEYGCILSRVQRSAGLLLRNAFNRSQEESVAEFEAGESGDLPPGPDPFRSLQDLANEIVEAYQADIGFAS